VGGKRSHELARSSRFGFLLLGLAASCTGTIGSLGQRQNSSAGAAGSGASSGALLAGGVGSGGASGGASSAPAPADPGTVTLRRLNQTEYDNTVRDLLGDTSQPALSFLSDTNATGFDNNGDLLSLSPVRMDQYRQAADALAAEALAPPLRANILTCDPTVGDACITTFVTTFGARAYRRPLTSDETTSYLSLAAQTRAAGGTPDDVVSTVLRAMLVSPNFLFLVEIDPDPTSTTPHPLGPYEIASRLSYLVYGSMPDDALFESAQSGKINDPVELQAQLTRMLADPKAIFAPNFAEQWLGVQAIQTSQPDATLFPTFTVALAQSMQQEVDFFFNDFVTNNLPAESLLTANFTYVDDRLATHYGLPSPGATMTRVDLTGFPQRGGILGMGALLMATSRGNRTSPVARGRFTLSDLLCKAVPPPPPTVTFPPDSVITATTERAFLAAHRTNATCATCHNLMDPIGLGLENYDAIGAWRTIDAGQVIDVTGNLPDGTMFNGPRELSQALAKEAAFRPCLANAILTYATGRTLGDSDQPYVNAIAQQSSGVAVGLRDLLSRVVASDPFRQRRGGN
jgi:hypothetical protein